MENKDLNAIGIVRLMLTDGVITEEQAAKYFPELAESEDEKIRKALVDYFTAYKEQKECGIKTFYGIPTDSIIAWLEKQGEQRSKLVDFDLNANDSDLQEETYFIPKGFHAEIDGDKVVIKKGEQKPTEGEPKIKVDDWVCHNVYKKPLLIVEDLGEGDFRTEPKSIITAKEFREGFYRLWTIQDAKDGDVLVCDVNQRPFIFKGLLDPYHPNCPVAYCGIDIEGFCYVSKHDTWWTDCNVRPATQEQRDTLMKAIADAGYTFDFEKKELKLMEE